MVHHKYCEEYAPKMRAGGYGDRKVTY